MTETESISKMRALLGMLDYELRAIEGLEPKAEQVQSVARQQDAALSPDESGRSAAGNPTESLEEFARWCEEMCDEEMQLHAHGDDASHYYAAQQYVHVTQMITAYRSRGAA